MDMPLISVVMPAHNVSRYIAETLESILAQDSQALEIIVVDDCSDDDTPAIVQSFGQDRIHYIRLDSRHGGPSRPRNVGVRVAQAKYIAFCDADDLILPGLYQHAYSTMESYPALGMCFSNALRFDDLTGKELNPFLEGYANFEKLPKEQAGPHSWIITSEHSYQGLFFENYVLPSSVVVARHVFDAVGLFDESMTNADDRDMWLRISKRYPIAYLDRIGFRYRVRQGSISGRGRILAVNRIKVLEKNLRDDLPKHVRRQVHRLIAENYYNMGYAYQKDMELVLAREYFLMSLRHYSSLPAVKGAILTLLGPALYKSLKHLADRWRVIVARD